MMTAKCKIRSGLEPGLKFLVTDGEEIQGVIFVLEGARSECREYCQIFQGSQRTGGWGRIVFRLNPLS